MIKGVHTMFYSSEAVELRAFLRDKLGFTDCTDVGDGWLIFKLPEADMGVHPTEAGDSNTASGMHAISFYTDDIERTVTELKAKGVEFSQEVRDEGFGLVSRFKVPGGFDLQLYQPHYQS
jgi:catechol 2,3-dioxygenase-like lactoylglutathione lyase family enzyme